MSPKNGGTWLFRLLSLFGCRTHGFETENVIFGQKVGVTDCFNF